MDSKFRSSMSGAEDKEVNTILAMTRDFQQCGNLTSVGSDEPV